MRIREGNPRDWAGSEGFAYNGSMQSIRDRKPTPARRSLLRWWVSGGVGLLVLIGGLWASASDDALTPSFTPRGETPREGGLLWRFDEAEGFYAFEARRKAPAGQLCGARWAPGPMGQGAALRFDGTDDFLLIPYAPALSPRRALTLALWVYLERLPDIPWRNDFRFLVGKPSLRTYSLLLEQNGTLTASVYVEGRRQSVRTREPLPLGEWVHVVFTFDGETGLGRLYLNGTLVAEQQGASGVLDANSDPLVLGSAFFHRTGDVGGGVRSFPGALDELRLYPWALSPSEIERLARIPSSKPSEASPPKPARLIVPATLEGEPVLARVVVRPRGAPEVCPEVFYTQKTLGAPAPPTEPHPRLYRGSQGPSLQRGWGEALLPPGEALVSVDVGGGFTSLPIEKRIFLPPGETVVLPVELERRYDPRSRGYFAADLHVHTHASGDGVTPLETVVWAQAAADLDLAVISDHNTSVGHALFAAAAERLGMPYLLSEEITTDTWGHFNPLSLNPGAAVTVSPEKRPREYFQEARAKGATLIQVNHPLWGGGQGYFTRRDDPDFDGDFQAVEVLNGFNGYMSSTDRAAIEAVFALWTRGKRVVATAGSDDHNTDKLTSQVGTPRTYVYVELGEGEALTAERWLEGLSQGRAFVTTGPLVYLWAQGDPSMGPGSQLRLTPGRSLRLRIEVEGLQELRTLTLWYNGRILRTFPLQGTGARVEWTGRPRPGWYAATVEAEEGGFALTNPLWVEVAPRGEPPAEGGT